MKAKTYYQHIEGNTYRKITAGYKGGFYTYYSANRTMVKQ